MLVTRDEREVGHLPQFYRHLEFCGSAGIIEIYQQVIGDEGKCKRAPEILINRSETQGKIELIGRAVAHTADAHRRRTRKDAREPGVILIVVFDT